MQGQVVGVQHSSWAVLSAVKSLHFAPYAVYEMQHRTSFVLASRCSC